MTSEHDLIKGASAVMRTICSIAFIARRRFSPPWATHKGSDPEWTKSLLLGAAIAFVAACQTVTSPNGDDHSAVYGAFFKAFLQDVQTPVFVASDPLPILLTQEDLTCAPGVRFETPSSGAQTGDFQSAIETAPLARLVDAGGERRGTTSRKEGFSMSLTWHSIARIDLRSWNLATIADRVAVEAEQCCLREIGMRAGYCRMRAVRGGLLSLRSRKTVRQ